MKMTENKVRTWPKIFHTDELYFLNLTNIHDNDKLDAKKICWCWSPSSGSQACTGFAPLQEKNIRHGYCHGSVKFIRSSWFGQVNNPQFIVSYFINNYYFNRNLINFLFVSDTQWGMWPNNGTKWLTHREECLACVTFW